MTQVSSVTVSPSFTSRFVVHLLRYGRALCGQPGTPNTWPDDHRWVDDVHWVDVSCLPCLAHKLEDATKATIRNIQEISRSLGVS